MELRNVRTFLVVSELLSFTRAAEQLNYTQAAVTIQVKQLERELNAQLFERIGKTVRLTRQGEAFLPHAVELLRAEQAALAFKREPGTAVGTLHIGTNDSLLSVVFPEVLPEFRKRCPLVETVIKTGLIYEGVQMLKQNEVDLLFILDRPHFRSDWVTAKEYIEEIVFVAPSSHPLAREENISLKRLVEEPFILPEPEGSYCYELIQRLAAKKMQIVPVLEIGRPDVIVKLLLRDVGLSFLPMFFVKPYLERGELKMLKVKDFTVKMWMQLIYHKNKVMTLQMLHFINLVDEWRIRHTAPSAV